MRIVIRSTLGCCLIALVVLTSVHLGMARGTARVAGTIVLCTGTGPVTVTVDRDGQPVSRPHVCPDCVFSVMAGLAAPLELGERQICPRQLRFVQTRQRVVAALAVAPHARGPPRFL